MTLYDAIGKTYAQTRRSDPRIAAKLLEIVKTYHASTIVDIGAGTGSYGIGHKLSLSRSCQEGLRIWGKEEIW